MARGLKDLKTEYEGKELEFNCLMKKVTMSYVNSPVEYSQAEVAKDYNITPNAVRKIMDYAIIHCLVSKEEASKVMNKSKENQQRKHAEAGGSSIRHHLELMRKRENFIAKDYEKTAIMEVVNMVVYGADDIYECYKECNIESPRLFWLIIERAIAENICTDTELDIITQKCYRKELSVKRIGWFRHLIEKRVEYRRKNN